MPGDELADENSRLHLNAQANGGDDLSDPATAERRLRQEAFELKKQPLSYGSRGLRDVTADFVAASEKLRPGELVQDEYFTLFEAVGALEIMDPKMDSGCIPLGDSFEPEFDVCRALDPFQTLWIMDELFRLEMSFHDGYPLSQNIFTSLHVFRLLAPENRYPYFFRLDHTLPNSREANEEQLMHLLLRAYCIAVIKSTEAAIEKIKQHTYYEEEDFVTYLFGRELLPKTTNYDALQLLTEAMDWVRASDLDPAVKHALKIRLVAREDLLLSMEGAEQWDVFKDKIDGMDKHHDLAKPVPAAFSDKVQRQLATSTPPRPMPQLSWQQACQKWRQLCDEVIATRTLTSSQIRQSPYCLQRATWAFAYRDPPPGTFSRAMMQDILTGGEAVAGEVPHFDLMLTDIRDLVLAGDPLADPASFQVEMPTDPRHRASRLIEDFMGKAYEEYLNLFRMVCQNRCRLRRTLTQAITFWEQLEDVAIETDRQLGEIVSPRIIVTRDSGEVKQHKPLRTWAGLNCVRVKTWVLQVGFETDLYLPEELFEIYCVIAQMVTSLMQGLALMKDRLSVGGGRRAITESSEVWIESLSIHGSITSDLAMALSTYCHILGRLGIIDMRIKPYQREQERYEARYKPFIVNKKTVIDDLKDINMRKVSAYRTPIEMTMIRETLGEFGDVMKSCQQKLNQLKDMDATEAKYVGTEKEWLKEMNDLKKTCIGTSLGAATLLKVCEKHKDNLERVKDAVEMKIPELGNRHRYHPWWIVPHVTEKP